MAHPQFAQLHAYAQFIASQTGATLGFLPEGGNMVGAHVAGAISHEGVAGILAKDLKAVILLNVEPGKDVFNPVLAKQTLSKAGTVIALSSYDSDELREVADVILPVAPYTETSGTYINMEGVSQSVQAAVRPLGDTRPAWKVMRVLGNLLNLDGFYFDSSEEVFSEATAKGISLDNNSFTSPAITTIYSAAIERLTDLPIYSSDAIVRRAASLQVTADAKRGNRIGLSSQLFSQLGLQEGASVKVTQDGVSVIAVATQESFLHAGVVRISAGTAISAQLGAGNGLLTVERA
jgi:NADH-quinone oxidoreductase subunit G